MTVANPEQFTTKGKPITYIKVFLKLYNWKNHGHVYKIYAIVELEKWWALTAKNPCNLGAYCIVEISSILRKTHIILRDQEKIVFYINNYIYWDQFNQLYDPD